MQNLASLFNSTTKDGVDTLLAHAYAKDGDFASEMANGILADA